MRFEINIDYPVEKMEASRKRAEARAGFQYADRVPVAFCLVPRYFTRVFGMKYNEFFKDAETQYYWWLQFTKWRIENVVEDYCQGPNIVVFPYFDNVVNASAMGGEIGWGEDETPRAIPTLKDVSQVESFRIPEPTSGLWGKSLAWREEMKEFVKDTRVTFNGEPGNVHVAPPFVGGEGPHMVAIDLVGEDFYWWQLEYPEACHALLDKITKGMIRAERYFRQIDTSYRGGYGLAEDAAQIMSADAFREFCVPYDTALYDEFGAGLKDGRGMHMCGNSKHLLKALKEDARISSFNVFGYLVEPKTIAEELGGDVYLWGNVNPMQMLTATKGEVKAEAMRCLEGMAPCGGFMLGDGANVCPGTPLENIAALTEAAEEYGLPEARPRTPVE